ncbi:methyl acetate hydrolase [Roseiarcus fermentans]|uniref:Methyl acetate hydrolase n=1 Tax=Roseiarcus fermentans TaxID=1473586 RepID=A0A366ERR8_9HYPH|nr:serine hydrolase domain-containing protein [Roseiarcus fermentans]RBP04199.1 methyl acetate hydrolase [Roseiarcus fermentans]
MDKAFSSAADAILRQVVSGEPRAPGVVAMLGDRDGTVYEGAAGVRRLGEPQPMTPDSVFALFSCSKAITGTAVLQLVEQGLIDLDAPAKRYLPEIGALQVLDGFDETGAPRLRAPRRDVTTRMLMLHTAGFGYPYFSAALKRLAAERGQPDPRLGLRQGLATPLLFDPGDAWAYGIGIDWAGQVVEAIAGDRLDAILKARVFAPLGMADTAFVATPSMRTRRAAMHQRGRDGGLQPIAFDLPEDPEVWMGGGALLGSAADYLRFLRMWLNDGLGEGGRVLRPETVAMAARNHLSGLRVAAMASVSRGLTHDAEFFPGIDKGWGLTFMVNEQAAPTGRPAGSIGWAGLGNLYYWIDRRNGVAGFWACQLFPFMDPVALDGFLAFETAAYDALGRRG